MKRHGMKTRSRRGRLSVRKTRSQRKSQRKCKQRGGNFIQSTLGIPKGSAITVNTLGGDPEEPIASYVTIKEEEGAD